MTDLPELTRTRLVNLAMFLMGLPREKWYYYGSWVSQFEDACGTVCCAGGWLPKADPANWAWTIAREGWRDLMPCLIARGHVDYEPIRLKADLMTYFEGLSKYSIDKIFINAEECFGFSDRTFKVMPVHVGAVLAHTALHHGIPNDAGLRTSVWSCEELIREAVAEILPQLDPTP